MLYGRIYCITFSRYFNSCWLNYCIIIVPLQTHGADGGPVYEFMIAQHFLNFNMRLIQFCGSFWRQTIETRMRQVSKWSWNGGHCNTWFSVQPVVRIPGRHRLRSSSTSALNDHVPPTRLSTVGDRAFPVAAARTWNSLPAEVTSSNSLQTFKTKVTKLKSHLFLASFA